MSFATQKDELIAVTQKALQEGRAKVMIGFTRDEDTGKATPFFMRQPEDAGKLQWDDRCTPNLAKYLLEKREGVGIIAKPCDARAIVMYLTEQQIKREALYIIGVECPGMSAAGGGPACGCESCRMRIPPIYDCLVKFGAAIQLPAGPTSPPPASNQTALQRFQAEIDKCILCYSCRQACYGCYCNSCFMELTASNWLPGAIDAGAKMTFHLGRMMHIAGRCVECGACERVCPSGVKLRYLLQEVNQFIKESYGYEAGFDPEATPALATFTQNDSEAGIDGGESK
jgi:formate dehydrogenase subunit beta